MNVRSNFKYFQFIESLLGAGSFISIFTASLKVCGLIIHFTGEESEFGEFKETTQEHTMNGHVKICTGDHGPQSL